ncbi:MAG: alanyl-tRNA editing protein [Myxococcales bacterium]|nr:alanyl-tRNA editing protein [Myxococcales bacterium]
MSGTERLYYADSTRLSFEASVVAHRTLHPGEGHPGEGHPGEGGPRQGVVLDRSAFYPESGGQMADHGQLLVAGAAFSVDDVQAHGDDVVHFGAGVLPALGETVVGDVDRTRRRIHMALHSGQHILSRALSLEAQAETTSSRLGESACTIDVDRERLQDDQIQRALDLANSLIDDDVAIRSFFPTAEELASLPLRKEATVDGPVRVVQIGDFDVTPCGGTHCIRSGQVGLVDILQIERHKQRLRLTFVAGPRGRRELSEQARILRSLAKSCSSAPDRLADAVAKLSADGKILRQQLVALEDALATELAGRLERRGDLRLGDLGTLPASVARAVVKRAASEEGAVVIVGTQGDDGWLTIAARGPGSHFDCRAFVTALNEVAEGRGGGRPERAEARLSHPGPWSSLVDRALAVL